MKVIARLPEARYFKYIKQTDDWYIFEDECTPLVRIYSPTKDIKGKWCVMLSLQFQKSDNNKYPYLMILKLFPVDQQNANEQPVDIVRNIFKSKFPHSHQPTIFYAAFPKAGESMVWVSYSFIS